MPSSGWTDLSLFVLSIFTSHNDIGFMSEVRFPVAFNLRSKK